MHLPHCLGMQPLCHEAQQVGAVTATAYKEGEQQQGHQHAGQQGAQSCAEQAEFGERANAIYQQVVANDVLGIAYKHDPHAHGGIGNAVCELSEGIEEGYEDHAHEHGQEVEAYQGEQRGWLPEPG